MQPCLVMPQTDNKYRWDLYIYDRINRNRKYPTQHNFKKRLNPANQIR